jgi:glutathione synthase/RimK-type ligase-like ATP-grasp enzyme
MPSGEYVLKERRSSGGHGVSLCEGHAIPDDERFVVQERMHWSDDLRAMVVDGRVEHWLRRRPAEGEWRTNIAQGSHYSSALDVSPEAESLALRAARACNLLWCGVDLLEVNGEWTVLEVNPGTTFHGVTREEGQAIVESVADAIERTLP